MRKNKKILFDHNLSLDFSAGIYTYNQQDKNFTNHAHHDLEINLVCSGTATITLRGEHYEIEDDHLIILRPLEYHRLSNRSSDFEMKVVVYPSRSLENYAKTDDSIDELLKSETSLIRKLKPDHKDRLLKIIGESLEKDISQVLVKNLVKSLYIMFFDFYKQADRTASKSSLHKSIVKILMEIEARENSLTLQEAAGLVDMNPETISRLFKTSLKMGYNQYVNRERLKSFMQNYVSYDDNLLASALNAGFNSYRSFYRTFKGSYGKGPREYFSPHTDN